MAKKEEVLHQLKIVRGQLEAIISMIEAEDHNCSDILTQIAASEKGLRRSAGLILEGNILNCIDPSIDKEVITKIVGEFKKFL